MVVPVYPFRWKWRMIIHPQVLHPAAHGRGSHIAHGLYMVTRWTAAGSDGHGGSDVLVFWWFSDNVITDVYTMLYHSNGVLWITLPNLTVDLVVQLASKMTRELEEKRWEWWGLNKQRGLNYNSMEIRWWVNRCSRNGLLSARCGLDITGEFWRG
jgi:hypothetical protein